MLPISLKFEGLNSYANTVTIDFTKFYSSRLFGIFGATGSGKSTILDAIILSIYGKIPRLSGKIDEVINPRRKYIDLEFVFEASGEKFKIYRHIGEKNRTVKLYKLTGEKPIPIAEKDKEFQQKIFEIIGLSYEEFSKVVILPQNHFAELLSMKPADRAVLIGKLFDLHYFGEPLYNRFSEKYFQLEIELNEKKRRLEELKEISEESILEKKRELQRTEQELSILKTSLDEKIQKLNSLMEFKQLREQKSELEKELKNMEDGKQEIETLKKKIQLDDALAPYRKLIEELKNLSSAIEKNTSQLSSLEKELAQIKTKLTDKKSEKEEFDRYFSVRSEELIGKIKECEQIQEIEGEVKALSEKVMQRHSKLKELEVNIKETEKNLKKIDQETTTTMKLLENVEENLRGTQLKEFELSLFEILPKALIKINDIRNLREEIEKLSEKIEKDKRKEEEGFIKIKEEFKKKLSFPLSRFEEIDEVVLARTKGLREERERLIQKLEELKTKNSAYILSKTLVEGKPCPVCGSPAHPSPAQSIDEAEIVKVNQKIINLDEEIKNIEEFKLKITPLIKQVLEARISYHNYGRELKEKENKLSRTREELLQILNEEHWENAEILYEQLKERKNRTEKLMREQKKLTETFQEKMNQKYEISERKIQLTSEREKIKNELNELNRDLEDKKRKLYQKTSGKSSEDIRLEADRELTQLKSKQAQLESELRKIENQFNELTVNYEKLKQLISRDRHKHDEIFGEIETKARELGIEAHKISLVILDEKSRKDMQKRIEEFEQKLNKTRGALDNIVKSLNQIPIERFDEDLLKDMESQVSELNEKLQKLNEHVGTLKEQIRTEKSLFEEKKRVKKEIETLHGNFENVKILRNLTYGKEMVKFFSWHLLKEVVLLANQIMTTILGKRFYLRVNSNLEFTVNDLYYNNERSVTTLSGGEIFVVSFSLALALSSYIQRKRRKIIQFFFIDEGFSSLDRELTDSVSAVLNELKSQDRLVGFITHVSEIKQLIPCYIEVKRDTTGSSNLRINF